MLCKATISTLFPSTSSPVETKHPEMGTIYSVLGSKEVASFSVFPRPACLSESPKVLAENTGSQVLSPEILILLVEAGSRTLGSSSNQTSLGNSALVQEVILI